MEGFRKQACVIEKIGLGRRLSDNKLFVFRDGRFRIGDELINVNGTRLRGVSLEQARACLSQAPNEVDIVIARDPDSAIYERGDDSQLQDSLDSGCAGSVAADTEFELGAQTLRATVEQATLRGENLVLGLSLSPARRRR